LFAQVSIRYLGPYSKRFLRKDYVAIIIIIERKNSGILCNKTAYVSVI